MEPQGLHGHGRVLGAGSGRNLTGSVGGPIPNRRVPGSPTRRPLSVTKATGMPEARIRGTTRDSGSPAATATRRSRTRRPIAVASRDGQRCCEDPSAGRHPGEAAILYDGKSRLRPARRLSQRGRDRVRRIQHHELGPHRVPGGRLRWLPASPPCLPPAPIQTNRGDEQQQVVSGVRGESGEHDRHAAADEGGNAGRLHGIQRHRQAARSTRPPSMGNAGRRLKGHQRDIDHEQPLRGRPYQPLRQSGSNDWLLRYRNAASAAPQRRSGGPATAMTSSWRGLDGMRSIARRRRWAAG